MHSLYTSEGLQSVKNRIDRLTPDTKGQWGKMNVAQMLGHVRIPLEVPLGRHTLPPSFMMRLFGGIVRKVLLSGKPLKKNTPTAPTMRVDDARHFDTEKAALLATLDDFSRAGNEGELPAKHPYFGKLSSEEWNKMQLIHLDHHLTQFGV